jgi:L-asparaginase/Glu-tRNA(Gln) amidotransferase subunit D
MTLYKAKILLIYTGGTIGMRKDFETEHSKPLILVSYCKISSRQKNN